MLEELADLDDNGRMRFIAAVLKSQEAGALLQSGDHAGGVAAYRAAIEICPPCSLRGDYHILLGCHYFGEGDAVAAEREFLAATQGDGASYPYEAYRRLAMARAAQGQLGAAVADMARAAAAGEDMAFAAQAIAVFEIGRGDLSAAARAVAISVEDAETNAEYRRRLALVRAELARLAGDAAGLEIALSLAAGIPALPSEDADTPEIEAAEIEAAEIDAAGIDPELALWAAVLDRCAGRAEVRPEFAAAFDAEPQDRSTLAWAVLNDRATPGDLVSRMENVDWGRRAEFFSMYRRLAGLLAEHRGDIAAARAHYEAARREPFNRWILDYHLAGIALARLGAA